MTDLNLGFSDHKIPVTPTIWHQMAHTVIGVKIVRHWGGLLIGGVAFTVTFFVTGETVTARIILARLIEALGDVAFDRGITPGE